MKLTVLIDSHAYVASDPYQRQFHARLTLEHECQYVELDQVLAGASQPEHRNVFVCLRFRKAVEHRAKLRAWTLGHHVVIQDYDPWVFFDDSSPHVGGYQKIAETLPSAAFAVPNSSWAQRIEEATAARVYTFRLGMSPELCSGPTWEARERRLEFKGSSYPTRERAFQRLSSRIPVVWNREIVRPYDAFLGYLRTLRVWAQDESEPVSVAGSPVCRNWLWPKAVEVLSQGCFLIRDRQPEALAYGLDTVPTCYLYDDIDQSTQMLYDIETMDPTERNDRISRAVQWAKDQDFYGQICRDMEGWWL